MLSTERILFGVYVLVGPLAWLLVAYFVKIGRERMNKLVRNRDVLSERPPLVSILVPAKDEGERIADCINGVLEQDYPHFELVAVNDRSTDNTGAILETFVTSQAHDDSIQKDSIEKTDSIEIQEPRGSAAIPSVRVVHIETLPPGWLGKCHALDQAARHARGEWLLFVDSDVRLQPTALSKLAAVAIAREYDAVSILTTIETATFVERLMLPLLAASWMTLFSGDQTNEDSETEKALANGQVFLIRASAYAKVGGHAAVKDRIVEDVELMRLLKKEGFKTRFLSGAHLAATRMHTHLGQMFNGWARIFAGTARGRVWPMAVLLAFLLIGVFGLVPAIVMATLAGPLATAWLAAALAHWLLMTGVAAFAWRWSGNPIGYALLLPISVPIEIAILVYAIRKAISGKIDWRGSAVDLRQTSRVAEKTEV